jgi:hypothetical protein
MQVHDDVEYDVVLRHQIAQILFVILPKTLAALISVIHGDEKQGQLLIAVSTLHSLLSGNFQANNLTIGKPESVWSCSVPRNARLFTATGISLDFCV